MLQNVYHAIQDDSSAHIVKEKISYLKIIIPQGINNVLFFQFPCGVKHRNKYDQKYASQADSKAWERNLIFDFAASGINSHIDQNG